ncbi:hypothetical protein Q9G87_59125 [Nonomuraea sp. G32]|nr:hypothetical protein [Nonomuraea sp. G32]MDP4511933.1 hypothetical protein [Nonomuraea sp. G32]
MIDAVEARLDVSVQHPAVSLGAEQVNLGDRVVRAPVGPKPIRTRMEVRLEDGLQDQLQRSLHHPIGDGRDPQPAQLPAGLGDHPLPHRQRPEGSRLQCRADAVQVRAHPGRLDVGGTHAVHARRPGSSVARDPLKRHHQGGRVADEVEDIVEPEAVIG